MAPITVAQILHLRAEVKRHKAAIYRHKLDLHTAAAALKHAEDIGRRIGLVLDVPSTRVEETPHGDTADQHADPPRPQSRHAVTA